MLAIFSAYCLVIFVTFFALFAILAYVIRSRSLFRLPNEIDSLPTRESLEEFAAQRRTETATIRQRQFQGSGDTDDYNCCICLDRLVGAVELLPCGHYICASCAISMWNHRGSFRRMACPLDRCPIEAIVPALRLRDRIAQVSGVPVVGHETSANDQILLRYNESFRHTSTISGTVMLVRRSLSCANLIPRTLQLRVILVLMGSFLYIFSPIDAVPEAVFGVIGLVDDFFVVLIMLKILADVGRRIVTRV
eukprot:Tbor_TRINITY_DN2833_c0_g1::TRINITY_DN2833_c0_g1_i1::g.23151::m.23151/K15707/RNF170; RING finger protein 170